MEAHFATLVESVVDVLPDAECQVHGRRRQTYAGLDDRASRFAAGLLAAGLTRESRLGLCLRNRPEYMEAFYGALKVRTIPVNVNHRYRADELVHLLADAEAEALVFEADLADVVAEAAARLPRLRLLVEVDPKGEAAPPATPGAVGYEALVAGHDPAPRQARSAEDLLLFYTGGTTGLPRGVMWSAGVLSEGYLHMGFPRLGLGDPPADLGALASVARTERGAGRAPVSLPAAPLMHGTAHAWGGMIPLMAGGCIALLEQASFSAREMVDLVAAEGVTSTVVVGEAFARPLLELLAADPAAEESRLATLGTLITAGAMMATESKQQLLAHLPQVEIVDVLGSTEGLYGWSVMRAGEEVPTGTFEPGPATRVIDDDGHDIAPGSEEIGRVAANGFVLAHAYYKDPEKTAAAFPIIDGTRHIVPGDWAMVRADGRLRLLGRGSGCINTGGEKVFAEEVEEAIKDHPDVVDCLVLGIPDERFGQAVAAVVEPRPGATVDAATVVAHVKGRLAGYKAPRAVAVVPEVPRHSGKPDLKGARALLGAEPPR